MESGIFIFFVVLKIVKRITVRWQSSIFISIDSNDTWGSLLLQQTWNLKIRICELVALDNIGAKCKEM